jgi:cell cycle arrest protein BUB3
MSHLNDFCPHHASYVFFLRLLFIPVQKFDMGTSSTSLIGVHPADPAGGEPKNACSCLASLDKTGNIVASAGWHSQFHVWDVRTANRPVITLELPGKAFSMDSVNDNRVVVGTSSRRNCIIDVRMSEENDPFAEIILDRESSLKYQTRSVRFFPDGKGLAVASIEGRVAVEFLEELGVKAGRFLGTTVRRVFFLYHIAQYAVTAASFFIT